VSPSSIPSSSSESASDEAKSNALHGGAIAGIIIAILVALLALLLVNFRPAIKCLFFTLKIFDARIDYVAIVSTLSRLTSLCNCMLLL
jgi:uncharacterized membrane protein YkvI